MYADRYAARRGIDPGSLGIAVGINVAVVAGLMLANPEVVTRLRPDPLTIFTVKDPPPPDPIKPVEPPKAKVEPREVPLTSPDPIVPTLDTKSDFVLPPMPPQPPVEVSGTATGTGSGTAVVDPPRPALPVLVQPGIDPRYAGLFQPPYPPAEERAGATGRVVVRVLVGVDGRVKQVERVLASSDAFYRVTEQRALAKWRFTPGTRDGVPVEAWRTMTVTFVIPAD